MSKRLLSAFFFLWLAALGNAFAGEAGQRLQADFGAEAASPDARFAASWITGNADNQGMPFVVVDKKNARLFVFESNGRLIAATATLLGLGIGDQTVADIARRPLSSLRPEERTTPAGRFVSEPGHNLNGEDIVWVDYGAKVAIHRLRADFPQERRGQRLASASIEDNRISLGCIVVPVAFYENVIRPVLGKRYGVVYVLPETRPVESMFGSFELSLNKP